jgi:putative membrane protein
MGLISSGRNRKCVGGLAGLAVFVSSQSAWALVGESHSDLDAWNVWSFTPAIVIPTVLICLVYIAGVISRRAVKGSVELWHHTAFAGGVLAIFIALESPIAHVADHLFFVNEVQHLLLHMVGPMLIALSAPQAMLVSGLPSLLWPKASSVGNSATLLTWFTNPIVVTALYIATLSVWQYPPYHDAALLSEPIRYLMHATMLAAGLLFWWRVFDLRPAPAGLTYGSRLSMLWVVILAEIAIGSYTTLKSGVLYPAYDSVGRLFGIPPLYDEMLGGLLISILSTMICLAGLVMVIRMWGRRETALDETGGSSWLAGTAVSAHPTTGEALVEGARTKNHTLAVGFAVFAIVVFATVLSIGVLNHLNGTTAHGLFASGELRKSVQ